MFFSFTVASELERIYQMILAIATGKHCAVASNKVIRHQA
jgi:hypothetical protein